MEDLGEIGEWEKDALLGGAYAAVCPAVRDASSGLALLEAMATGTPVVAYGAGVAPEVVVDGVTGFVCATLRAMERAVERITGLDRRACRAHVEDRFSPAVMATAYEHQYAALLEGVRYPRDGGAALAAPARRLRVPTREAGAAESGLGRHDDGLPIALPLRLDAGVPIPHAGRPPAAAARPVPVPRRDPVDIASEDSFPASDPPGWIGSGGEPVAAVAGVRAR